MINPVRIIMKPEELNVDGIEQFFIAIAISLWLILTGPLMSKT